MSYLKRSDLRYEECPGLSRVQLWMSNDPPRSPSTLPRVLGERTCEFAVRKCRPQGDNFSKCNVFEKGSMCKFQLKCTLSRLFYYFIKIRKGVCIKTKSCGCCFEGSQKVFWFWQLLGGAKGAMWVANIIQFFDRLVLPLKVKIKHNFGILQSNTQDLVGFFI